MRSDICCIITLAAVFHWTDTCTAVASVKGGDLNKFLLLNTFVILRQFIEIHGKATFWRTVPFNVTVLFIVCTWRKSSCGKTRGIHRYVNHGWQLRCWKVRTNCQDKRNWYRHVIYVRTDLWRASWMNWSRKCHVSCRQRTHAVFNSILHLYSYTRQSCSGSYRHSALWVLFCILYSMPYCFFNISTYITANHDVNPLTHAKLYQFVVFCNVRYHVLYTIWWQCQRNWQNGSIDGKVLIAVSICCGVLRSRFNLK
jgi:hypothetical protein